MSSIYSAGKVSITPRGQYSPTTKYERLDLVSNQGSSYLYINPEPATGVGLNNSAYWMEIGKKGDTGLKGDTGEGVPSGGNAGQILAKTSNDNYSTQWIDDVIPSNPNILHNWDWRNPINQRSVTSFNREYGIDRWIASNNKEVTITESGLVILNGGWIIQRLENRLINKTVTVSARTTDGNITSGTGVFPTAVNGRTDINKGRFNFILYCRANFDEIVITPQVQDETIEAVKLELGSVSTLHLDPPMDWAVELPKCQRFYQLRSSNNIQSVDMRPTMRIANPTISGTGPYAYIADI
ncbi:MAG: hypothetical protein ACOX7B_03250 [Christensenellales bacterium]|jgi:hypothetical protein